MTAEFLAQLVTVMTDAAYVLQDTKRASRSPIFDQLQERHIGLGKRIESMLPIVKAELLQTLRGG